MKKILVLFVLAIALGLGVYYFDYLKTKNEEQQKIAESKIINFNCDQINFIEILHKDENILLQKNVDGWSLHEPVQDSADNEQVENTLKTLCDEKYLAVAKEEESSGALSLQEYGLDDPQAIVTLKNNQQSSKKIAVGSQKNFEGNAFIRIDSENRVLVAAPTWFSKTNEKPIFFREKRLYRGQLPNIDNVKITSLSGSFEIDKKDGKWFAPKFPDYVLDQDKVRNLLKKISEVTVQEYLAEAEPSLKVLKEKGLITSAVKIELDTAKEKWSADINLDPKDKSLNALTNRPTKLMRLEISSWEFLGNVSLDSLRDRDTLLRFERDHIAKFYLKIDKKEASFVKEKLTWKVENPTEVTEKYSVSDIGKIINKVHDLEISEFIEKKSVPEFKGQNMIIFKSESDNLIYQINWGPEVKISTKSKDKVYYLARTQVDPMIFAIEFEKINELGLYELLQMPPAQKSTDPLIMMPRPVMKPKPIEPSSTDGTLSTPSVLSPPTSGAPNE